MSEYNNNLEEDSDFSMQISNSESYDDSVNKSQGIKEENSNGSPNINNSQNLNNATLVSNKLDSIKNTLSI